MTLILGDHPHVPRVLCGYIGILTLQNMVKMGMMKIFVFHLDYDFRPLILTGNVPLYVFYVF